MSYRVEFTKWAEKAFSKLPKQVQKQLQADINQLAELPRPPGCLKMKGRQDLWRVRSGDYRVIYQIRDNVLVVVIVDIGHRSSIYN